MAGRRGFLFLLFCVCLVFSSARAAEFSGEYLLQVCASDKDGKEITPGGHIACQAYIAGVLDYHNLLRSLGTAPGVDFCVPQQETLNRLQRRVTSFIFKNRAEHGGFTAAPGVALALFENYPCGKKK